MKKRIYYRIEIVETGRSTLKSSSEEFNTIVETKNSITDVKEYLKERYNKIPKRKISNTIYKIDLKQSAIPIGFTYSFWNKDISHNTKSWYQTDWITIIKIKEEVERILIN